LWTHLECLQVQFEEGLVDGSEVLLDTGLAEAVCDAADEAPVFGKSLEFVSDGTLETMDESITYILVGVVCILCLDFLVDRITKLLDDLGTSLEVIKDNLDGKTSCSLGLGVFHGDQLSPGHFLGTSVAGCVFGCLVVTVDPGLGKLV